MPDKYDYLEQAKGLLPKGPIWEVEEGTNLSNLLLSFAKIFAIIDNKSTVIKNEAIPLSSQILLDDWEEMCGLPDECALCVSDIKTTEERRNDIINLLISGSSPTISFFKNVAKNMGYEIEVNEITPFKTGLSKCGDMLNGKSENRFHFVNILIKDSRVVYFKTGVSKVSEKLGAIRYATELECVLNKIKPAHTNFIYSYKE